MIVRVGLPEMTGALPRAVRQLNAPALVSASRLWQRKERRWRIPGAARRVSALDGLDVALDSAGFTVMVQWKGVFPWTPAAYADLAAARPWAWWSSMDLCCEQQVAADREEVRRRVDKTAGYLGELLAVVDERQGLRDPMPILQGRMPDDYRRSLDLTLAALARAGRGAPALMGLGSVCRRNLQGEDGIFALLDGLRRDIPRGMRLHLFGVKGAALEELAVDPLVASTDSMAWDFAARRQTWDRARRTATTEERIGYLVGWHRRNLDRARGPAQQRLFGGAA